MVRRCQEVTNGARWEVSYLSCGSGRVLQHVENRKPPLPLFRPAQFTNDHEFPHCARSCMWRDLSGRSCLQDVSEKLTNDQELHKVPARERGGVLLAWARSITRFEWISVLVPYPGLRHSEPFITSRWVLPRRPVPKQVHTLFHSISIGIDA